MATYTVTGLDATGATDVTAGLQAFLDSIPDGTAGSPNTMKFELNASYRMDGTFEVTSRNYLIIDGNGSTCTATTQGVSDRPGFRETFSVGIRFTDIAYVGFNANAGTADNAFNPSYIGQHGFALLSGSDITIDHCDVSLIYGDMIYITSYDHGTTVHWVDGFLVENNNLISCGRNGMAFLACRNGVVRNNTFGGIRYAQMDFEPHYSDHGTDNVWVHHNAFGTSRLTWISGNGAPAPVENITIEDNTIVGRMNALVQPAAYNTRRGWIIRRNVASSVMGNGSGAASTFERCDGLILQDNVCPLETRTPPMYIAEFINCLTPPIVSGNSYPGGAGEAKYTQTYFPGVDPVTTDVPDAYRYTAPTVAGFVKSIVQPNLPVTVAVPVGAQVGDLAVAFLATRWADNPMPPGWDAIISHSRVGDVVGGMGPPLGMRIVSRRIVDADLGGNMTFTFSAAPNNSRNYRAVFLVVLRGADGPTFTQAVQLAEGNIQEVQVPPVTTAVPNSRVFFFLMHGRGDNGYLPGETDQIILGQDKLTPLGMSAVVSTFTIAGTGGGRQRILSAPFEAPAAVIGVVFAPVAGTQAVFLIRRSDI